MMDNGELRKHAQDMAQSYHIRLYMRKDFIRDVMTLAKQYAERKVPDAVVPVALAVMSSGCIPLSPLLPL